MLESGRGATLRLVRPIILCFCLLLMLGACDVAAERCSAGSDARAELETGAVAFATDGLGAKLEVVGPDVIVVDLDIDEDAEPMDALLVNHSFVILADVN